MSLEVKGLLKKYGDKVVVNELSFTMQEPGVYALLGTNGAGKTTSIRMMLEMIAKDGGEVLWEGKPLKPLETRVGYLAEERGLYPKYELMDQLLYFASLKKVAKEEAKKRIRRWSEILELDEYLYPELSAQSGRRRRVKPMKADQLSKGNQQKIQLMAALIDDPELLIFDEPISGLDPVNTDLFKKIIRQEIEKGKYIIMSSHQMATVEEFCEDITILNHGNSVLQGNLNEIKRGYGRVNLEIKCDDDFSDVIEEYQLQIMEETPDKTMLKVSGEEQARAFLSTLIGKGHQIVLFELREPSLHEIFIETVGGASDEEE
ncbi:MAG: ATP-binding cassette domain-containing protein [Lachnospiraceae bacterium]|nr:ATP-binding cassette domain-containing protein [Lachnospiraceae bacterium]